MRGSITVALALVAVGAMAAAPAKKPSGVAKPPAVGTQCKTYTDRIVGLVQDMGVVEVDTAAPRSVHDLQIQALQSQIQSTENLMAIAKCPPYTGPKSPMSYLLPAMKCYTATLKEDNNAKAKAAGMSQEPIEPGQSSAELCDRSTWKGVKLD